MSLGKVDCERVSLFHFCCSLYLIIQQPLYCGIGHLCSHLFQECVKRCNNLSSVPNLNFALFFLIFSVTAIDLAIQVALFELYITLVCAGKTILFI